MFHIQARAACMDNQSFGIIQYLVYNILCLQSANAIDPANLNNLLVYIYIILYLYFCMLLAYVEVHGGAIFYDFQISLWMWGGATGECIQSNYNLSAHWFHVNTSSWWSIAQPTPASPPPPIHWYTMLLTVMLSEEPIVPCTTPAASRHCTAQQTLCSSYNWRQ